jgi:membrane protease YdiL (CAAX protease family)
MRDADDSVVRRCRTTLETTVECGTLTIFFVLVYVITWTLFITVAKAVPARTASGYVLVLIGAYAPAVVAISLTAWTNGVDGVRKLLGPLLFVDVPRRYYVFAILYIVVVKLAAAVLYRAILGVWPVFDAGSLAIAPFAIAISTPFQAGEEIGWRGYALPRLAARLGFARASLLLGVIWAFWHLPQFYIADADTFHQSFPVWAAGVVAMSVAFAWLYMRAGGSLILVMLLHASINNAKDIVPSGSEVAPGVFSLHASTVSWITLGVLGSCAGYLLTRLSSSDRRRSVTPA